MSWCKFPRSGLRPISAQRQNTIFIFHILDLGPVMIRCFSYSRQSAKSVQRMFASALVAACHDPLIDGLFFGRFSAFCEAVQESRSPPRELEIRELRKYLQFLTPQPAARLRNFPPCSPLRCCEEQPYAVVSVPLPILVQEKMPQIPLLG